MPERGVELRQVAGTPLLDELEGVQAALHQAAIHAQARAPCPVGCPARARLVTSARAQPGAGPLQSRGLPLLCVVCSQRQDAVQRLQQRLTSCAAEPRAAGLKLGRAWSVPGLVGASRPRSWAQKRCHRRSSRSRILLHAWHTSAAVAASVASRNLRAAPACQARRLDEVIRTLSLERVAVRLAVRLQHPSQRHVGPNARLTRRPWSSCPAAGRHWRAPASPSRSGWWPSLSGQSGCSEDTFRVYPAAPVRSGRGWRWGASAAQGRPSMLAQRAPRAGRRS